MDMVYEDTMIDKQDNIFSGKVICNGHRKRLECSGYHRRSGGDAREKARHVRRRLRHYRRQSTSDRHDNESEATVV